MDLFVKHTILCAIGKKWHEFLAYDGPLRPMLGRLGLNLTKSNLTKQNLTILNLVVN